VQEKRIDDIEFLRAIAIGMVIICHQPALVGWYGVALTEFQQYFVLGSGVNLFFAVSGFVITRSFINHNGGVIPTSFKAAALPFWTRRAFRILPAAWFWLTVTLYATVALNPMGNFGKFSEVAWDALTAVLQVANFSMLACNKHIIDLCAAGGIPNGIYWSLSMEEQFYLLFPVVLFFMPRRLLVPVLLVVTTVLVFNNWGFRYEGLLIGVLLGLASFHPLYQRLKPTFLESNAARWASVVVFLLLILVLPSPAFAVSGFGGGLLGVTCGIWVWVASHGYAMPRTRMRPFLMWMGSRSYSLYLVHMLVFLTTREIWMNLGLTGTGGEANFRYWALAALLLWLFAEGSYRLIEQPMRRRGVIFAGRMRPAPA
jgi:peptidoglycan/LPS O-acetylase OafA/YrhL